MASGRVSDSGRRSENVKTCVDEEEQADGVSEHVVVLGEDPDHHDPDTKLVKLQQNMDR